MRTTAVVKQTSDRLISSVEWQVTIIPLTIGLLLGGRVSIPGSQEIPFPGLRKKSRLETQVSLTSLVPMSLMSSALLFSLWHLVLCVELFTRMATQSLNVWTTFQSSTAIQYRACWQYCVPWVVSRLDLSMLKLRFEWKNTCCWIYLKLLNWHLRKLNLYLYSVLFVVQCTIWNCKFARPAKIRTCICRVGTVTCC